jgi:3-dehydroquinate dehydratase-1
MTFSLTNFVQQHQRPAIIVPIMARDMDEMCDALYDMNPTSIDAIEWRVDAALAAGWQPTEPEIKKVVATSYQPILFTWRTQAEGGLVAFDAKRFEKLYNQALKAGVWAVDVEFALREQLGQLERWLQYHQVMYSYHNFLGVSYDLTALFKEMAAQQPSVVKIAVMPKTQKDVSKLLELPKTIPTQPSIVIGMGSIGQVTRLQGWEHGSQATFASWTADQTSAPGQLTWQELWSQWQ